MLVSESKLRKLVRSIITESLEQHDFHFLDLVKIDFVKAEADKGKLGLDRSQLHAIYNEAVFLIEKIKENPSAEGEFLCDLRAHEYGGHVLKDFPCNSEYLRIYRKITSGFNAGDRVKINFTIEKIKNFTIEKIKENPSVKGEFLCDLRAEINDIKYIVKDLPCNSEYLEKI